MRTIEELNPPGDYLAPKWAERDRVHDWRNYVSEDMRAAWDTFSTYQKALIACNAEEQASNEEWD